MDKIVKVLVILLALVGIGLFGHYWFSQWHTKTVGRALEKERAKNDVQVAKLEAEINRLAEEMDDQQAAQTAQTAQMGKTKLKKLFGDEKPIAPKVQDEVDCSRIRAQAAAFFKYLDDKARLRWPENELLAEDLFDDLARRLSETPPINGGEMESLYVLVRNVTHFYRILGHERTVFIQELMTSESGVMEPTMAVIFAWMTRCTRALSGEPRRLDLTTLYRYAHFFLDTLGGRSYLLRRDTKQRMLINYYTVLIIDMANDAKLNSYGLDIRPHLDYVFHDIKNQPGLMYRRRYLSRLSLLQNKYH